MGVSNPKVDAAFADFQRLYQSYLDNDDNGREFFTAYAPGGVVDKLSKNEERDLINVGKKKMAGLTEEEQSLFLDKVDSLVTSRPSGLNVENIITEKASNRSADTMAALSQAKAHGIKVGGR